VQFRFDQVHKRLGASVVLDGLTLQFDSGSVSAILGPSGAGKSTLLRLLLGLEWPDAGRVLIDGTPLLPQRRLAVRRGIGYVIQEGGLFPHLTALGNLALLPQHLGWPRERIAARARELAALMQLPESVLGRYPSELSGGQRQRLAVARALMSDPSALLLDEPLGALDPLVRFELQERLAGLFRTLGKTVIMVTHDLPEAAFLADRLLLLHEGHILQEGAPADFLARPADEFVRRFVAAQRGIRET
jgi:osmoprotectant transport system ATP-binding protein